MFFDNIENEYKIKLPIPDNLKDLYNLYLLQQKSFWSETELNFDNDIVNIEKFDDDYLILLSYTLLFFRDADSYVNENIDINFTYYFKDNVVLKDLYQLQMTIENTHQRVYHLIIQSYCKNERFKNIFMQSQKNKDFIYKMETMGRYCIEYINDANCDITHNISSTEQYSQSKMNEFLHILKQLCVNLVIEGIIFPTHFAVIFCGSELIELCSANRFIRRDENIHSQSACLVIIKYFDKKDYKKYLFELVPKLLSVEEKSFANVINGDKFISFMKYMCNVIFINYLNMDECDLLYPDYKINPFPFMDNCEIKTKSNFMESKSAEYSHKNYSIDKDYFDNIIKNINLNDE